VYSRSFAREFEFDPQVLSSQQNAPCHGYGFSSYLKREFAVQGNHELANRGSII